MDIQEEITKTRNIKTLKDFNELFTKLNNMVKEELDMNIFEFLQEREELGNTVHYGTISKYSHKY